MIIINKSQSTTWNSWNTYHCHYTWKWDVITRKSDDLVKIGKLLILDEVHSLQDDRGSVIEAIVARTTRLVGLSATLPNYIDVAAFLKADNGVCYFDETYTPVPLNKTFIGVAEANSLRVNNMMNEICWLKCKNQWKKDIKLWYLFIQEKWQ